MTDRATRIEPGPYFFSSQAFQRSIALLPFSDHHSSLVQYWTSMLPGAFGMNGSTAGLMYLAQSSCRPG